MSTDERANHFDYIEFAVASPEAMVRTRDFLAGVFGWAYEAWGDAYAGTRSSGVFSGINAEDGNVGRPLPVVHVTDLEGTLAKVREAGAEITKPIFSFPGGRRFHFKEPSGNELAAWSDQPEANG